ncbi:MAG: GNAT family N-acetyltransferase [Ruminococcus sp.]
MDINIRKADSADYPAMVEIWNEVVEEGIAFPQVDSLDSESGAEFFGSQTYCAVAEGCESHEILGLYILHPNNVGRCGHICNASYAVKSTARNRHIGEKLVMDCLVQGKENGFKILQFNAVVKTNLSARHLYKKLGFTELGTIPNGFLLKSGEYEDIVVYYHTL